MSANSASKTQTSAYVSKVSENKRKPGFRPTPLVCKHCGVNGHTIERCFKLIGFPKDFQSQNQKRTVFNQNFKSVANNSFVTNNNSSQSSQPGSNVSLTEDQLQKLLSLLDKTSAVEGPSANMAGTFFCLCSHG